MIIKELHIRNIASIEKADIDFSKGLVDGVTGDPASVFLITGDTGAGKSVILDGISLALYKTTPRISGVANMQENEFRNLAGETIRLVDVQQYTRLGISPGDPCYSEVVFEGNDGREYRAKLSLGLYLGRKKKDADGPQPVKHCKPEWTVTCGGEAIPGKDTATVIHEAVGLDVNQFCRMAMLAQGQFATFLTGDKKERADVLQELTDTEQFLQYGQAVSRLFAKAKKDLEVAGSVYEEVRKRPHSREELDALEEERKQVEEDKRLAEEETAKVKGILDLVKAVGTADDELKEAAEEKVKLDELLASEEYVRSEEVVKAWDSTYDERQLLDDMRSAAEELKEAEAEKAGLSESFAALCRDLAFRQEQAAALRKTLEEEGFWLAERKDREAIWQSAGEWILRMEHYGKAVEDGKAAAEALREEKGKTAGLEQALTDRKAREQELKESVDAAQREIDRLKERLGELDPEGLEKVLREAAGRRKDLESLREDLKTLAGNESDRDARKAEIDADGLHLEELRKDAEQKEQLFQKDKKAYEDALKCQRTMNESREETLVRLRHELRAEGETVCPLCGQRFASLTEDIGELLGGRLAELDRMAAEAQARYDSSEKAWKDAAGEKERFSGALDGKRAELAKRETALGRERSGLESRAVGLGFEFSAGLVDRIGPALEALGLQEAEWTALQGKARALQNDINRLQEEKKPLDKALSEAGKEVVKAQGDLDGNGTAIARLERECREQEEEKDALFKLIDEQVGPFYPGWADGTIQERFREDAREYNHRSEAHRRGTEQQDRALSTLRSISAFRDSVLQTFPDWAGGYSPEEHPSEDVVSEWNGLSSRTGSVKGRMDTHRERMEECRKELDAWYAGSGKDEAYLDRIIARESEVEGCRTFLADAKERVQANRTLTEKAGKEKEEALGKLGAATDEEVPREEDLEARQGELSGRQDAAVTRLAEIAIRQKTLEDNIRDIADKEAAYEKALAARDKWKRMNDYFGGERFRTRVQTFILRPLLANANLYLEKITDRYELTCSEENQQLSILVLDKYNKREVRSATLLSGGERFMVSLALSLALSSLIRPDLNVNILFIDEGFGTLDRNSLDSVMQTLERVQEIAGVKGRRIGIISHRPELEERIPVKICVEKKGEGRSLVETVTSLRVE